jgi:hypothetical protein
VRRALLQRDLRAVFDWLAERSQRDEDAERALALAAPLARAVGRLALTPEELAGLRDPLAEAGVPGHPAPPALPRDLLDPGGPWVRLELAASRPLAGVHVGVLGARSAFEVLVALPGGRERTRAWIERLGSARALPGDDHIPRFPAELGPPPGTRVVLLRRALLLDTSGELQVSPLVESLQLREFEHADPAPRDPALEQVLFGQTALELRLDRESLLAGGPGLRRLRPEEREFATFMTHGGDPFESRGGADLDRWLEQPLERCGACHRGRGLDSFASLERFTSGARAGESPDLTAVDERTSIRRSLQLASEHRALALLRELADL